MSGKNNDDTIDGTTEDDQIAGGAGDDTLDGGDGDDRLIGGSGDDIISGGSGDDFLTGSSGDDLFEIAPGFGTDTINDFVAGADTDDRIWVRNLGVGSFSTLISLASQVGPDVVITFVTGDVLILESTSLSDLHEDDFIFDNSGDSVLTGTDGDDTLDGGGGSDTLDGGSGDDTFFGGDGDDTLTGGPGNDTLYGGAGNDYLYAGAGNDTVFGGAGNDLIIGGSGAGDDTYDGGPGIDEVSYASTTQGVTVDLVAGTATGPEIGTDTLISIENITGGSGADTITGDDDASRTTGNVLDGGAGDDMISGGDGRDFLIGGAGDDTLDGGFHTLTFAGYQFASPSDTADYSNDPAKVSVDLGAGTASDGYGGADTLIGIEAVIGSAFDDTLYGGGNDIFEEFEGGAGDDYIDGRSGFDQVDYQRSPGAITVDLATGTVMDGYGGTDTLVNIERVAGSAFGDTFNGTNAPVERFRGRGGDDYIDGGGGFDIADYAITDATTGAVIDLAVGTASDGEGGTDTLVSIEGIRGTFFGDTITGSAAPFEAYILLAGNDSLHGGAGVDSLRYDFEPSLGGSQGVTVDLAAGTATDSYGDTDTLSGIEQVFGTNFGDSITGAGAAETFFGLDGNDVLAGGDGNDTLEGAGGADTLRGGSDLDVLHGGPGDDIIDGGEGSTNNQLFGGQPMHDQFAEGDLVRYLDSPSSVSVDLGAGMASDGFGGTDTLSNIEVVLGSDFDDTLIGDPSANSRFDVENYLGEAGADTIIAGGAPLEAVGYFSSPTAVNVDLALGEANDGYGSVDSLTGINFVIGSSFNDALYGSSADFERFRSQDGSDLIDGRGGFDEVDYYFGGSRHGVVVDLALGEATDDGFGNTDTLISVEGVRASAYNDTLTGDGGDNRFLPMGGDDTVDGAGGTDELSYIYAPNGVVVDLSAGTASDGFGGTDSLTSIENVTGTLENDTITGDAKANQLQGDNGDDTLDGGAGNDTLNGGFGDDTFVFEDGTGSDTVNDFVAGEGSEDVLDVTAFGFASAADVIAQAEDMGSDVQIQLDDDDFVTLVGVQTADLHEDDFSFMI